MTERCEQCGFGRIVEEMREQRFQYGQDNPIELVATVLVMRCTDCGDMFSDYRGEDARQAVVDAHLADTRKADQS